MGESMLDRLERATQDRRSKNIGFLQVGESDLSALIAAARALEPLLEGEHSIVARIGDVDHCYACGWDIGQAFGGSTGPNGHDPKCPVPAALAAWDGLKVNGHESE